MRTAEVSIVIPAFNEAAWLAKTVESITCSRTDLRYEIVVVDDGCTDGGVEAVAGIAGVRVVPAEGERVDRIVAKNIGAKASRSRYLCFVDSHLQVQDYWLDYLRETCDEYTDGALVSGNLPGEADQGQYGYTIRNCSLDAGWYPYERACASEPYLEALTPGALLFTRKVHFARLGGFDPALRRWGGEDIQISLQNYCLGGENVVDPRVVLHHDYKERRGAAATFNRLYIAGVYFPYNYYRNVRDAMITRGGLGAVRDFENHSYQDRREKKQSEFVRGFDTWIVQFASELRGFLQDAERRSASAPLWDGDVSQELAERAP